MLIHPHSNAFNIRRTDNTRYSKVPIPQGQALKTLKTRQNRQVQDINRRFRALGSLERRESRSLKTALQRRQYKNLNREFRHVASAKEPEKQKRPSQEFSRQTPDQARTTPTLQKRPPSRHVKLEEIRETGQDITNPQVSEETKAQDSLAEAFRRAEKQKAKREQEKDRTRDDPGRTRSR